MRLFDCRAIQPLAQHINYAALVKQSSHMSPKSRQMVVTSALPYANGPIHIGHLLGYTQADIWVRFQKLRGHQCTFICADDTHGTPIMLKAQELGITPEALIAESKVAHENDFNDFIIHFDHYHSTHTDECREMTELIYNRLNAANLRQVDFLF